MSVAEDAAERSPLETGQRRHNLQEQQAVNEATAAYAQALANFVRGVVYGTPYERPAR